MKYKCIIFDCDGVLVDSEILSNQVLVDMVQGLGADIDLAFALKHFTGRALSSCLEIIEERLGGKLPEDFTANYRRQSYQIFKDHLQPVDGVHEFLSRLTIPYCVASSGPLEKIEANLTTTGLIDKFEGKLFSSYEINSWKPEPGIFLHAAEKMGFSPCDCAVIEDSHAGVQAAQVGGFDVYAYVPDQADNMFADMTSNVFHNMEALGNLLLTQ